MSSWEKRLKDSRKELLNITNKKQTLTLLIKKLNEISDTLETKNYERIENIMQEFNGTTRHITSSEREVIDKLVSQFKKNYKRYPAPERWK